MVDGLWRSRLTRLGEQLEMETNTLSLPQKAVSREGFACNSANGVREADPVLMICPCRVALTGEQLGWVVKPE